MESRPDYKVEDVAVIGDQKFFDKLRVLFQGLFIRKNANNRPKYTADDLPKKIK